MSQEKNCNNCRIPIRYGKSECEKLQCKFLGFSYWKPIITSIDDGGSRVGFGTGAIRESQEGKGRYDLITPEGLMRLANWYELGAIKYFDRNWEKGVPTSNCLNSLMRHTVKYLAGWNDEDHLAAIAWNAFAIMHMEKFHPELQDIESRKKQQEETQ